MKQEVINLDGKTISILANVNVNGHYETLSVIVAQKEALKVAKLALMLPEVFDISKDHTHLSLYRNDIVTAITDTNVTITGRLQDLPKCLNYESITCTKEGYTFQIALNETMFIHMYRKWLDDCQIMRDVAKQMKE